VRDARVEIDALAPARSTARAIDGARSIRADLARLATVVAGAAIVEARARVHAGTVAGDVAVGAR